MVQGVIEDRLLNRSQVEAVLAQLEIPTKHYTILFIRSVTSAKDNQILASANSLEHNLRSLEDSNGLQYDAKRAHQLLYDEEPTATPAAPYTQAETPETNGYTAANDNEVKKSESTLDKKFKKPSMAHKKVSLPEPSDWDIPTPEGSEKIDYIESYNLLQKAGIPLDCIKPELDAIRQVNIASRFTEQIHIKEYNPSEEPRKNRNATLVRFGENQINALIKLYAEKA